MPTSREKWTMDTRASTMRALAKEGIPLSAGALEGNLDCSQYISGMGFTGVRSVRSISSALNWCVQQGYARRVPESERTEYDPPGVLYEATRAGYEWAFPNA